MPFVPLEKCKEIDFSPSDSDLNAYYTIPIGDVKKAPFYFSDIVIGPQCRASEGEIQAFLRQHDLMACSIIKNSWTHMR